MLLIVLFWLFFALAIYPFLLYPGMLALHAAIFRRPLRVEPIEPRVSVVIAAWNEEDGIGERIENLLALDYPKDRLEVIIASDGSTDRTDEIVAEYAAADERVRLLALEHRGKTATVNAGVKAATGDIVISTDAGTRFAPDTVRTLVAYFADESVDCVVGELDWLPLEDAPYNRGQAIYRRFENWLYLLEAKAGVGFQGVGPCMATRREKYPDLPPDSSDDLSAPLQIAYRGGRVVLARDTGAYDYMDGSTDSQVRARVRRVVRGLESIAHCPGLLNPFRHGRLAITVISHKIMRWLTGIWMLGMLVTNGLLWWFEDILFYDVLFYLQAAFYLLALLGLVLARTRLARNPLLSIPMAICVVAVAFLRGMVQFVAGEQYATWRPDSASDKQGGEAAGAGLDAGPRQDDGSASADAR